MRRLIPILAIFVVLVGSIIGLSQDFTPAIIGDDLDPFNKTLTGQWKIDNTATGGTDIVNYETTADMIASFAGVVDKLAQQPEASGPSDFTFDPATFAATDTILEDGIFMVQFDPANLEVSDTAAKSLLPTQTNFYGYVYAYCTASTGTSVLVVSAYDTSYSFTNNVTATTAFTAQKFEFEFSVPTSTDLAKVSFGINGPAGSISDGVVKLSRFTLFASE